VQEVIYTFCPICAGHCSAKVTVEDGKIVKWEPDYDSGLPHEPCPPFKGVANAEIATHPNRLKYPMRRVGTRGEGKWERISWVEALDTIANKMTDLKKAYGPESVAFCLGEPKALEFAFAQRLAGVFGTPNVVTPSHLCLATVIASSSFTFGAKFPDRYPDTDILPKLNIIWGCNLVGAHGPVVREWLRASLLKGGKLVVIDPKKIDIAKRADMWIRPRPTSDGALAMGLLKVTIEEKLYDEDFVNRYAIGFEELEKEVTKFTLDDVERVTWVPKSQVVKLARMYAEYKPVFIREGNPISHGVNSFQAARAIDILRAISGPPNTPNTTLALKPGNYTKVGKFFLLSKFPRTAEKTLGSQYRWSLMTAYIPHHALLKAILEEEPYPVKATICVLTNPLVSYPDARRTYDAFNKLNFTVVAELFMTPTAQMADIVLPAATVGEYDTAGYWSMEGAATALRAYPKLVDPPGEAWSDVKWMSELAKKLGLSEYFWEDERGALDCMIEPSGLSWEEFKKKRALEPSKSYHELGEDTFDTPSGKIEIYSEQVQKYFGYNPLPRWEELSRLSYEPSTDYPLLLITRIEEAYKLTGFKHVSYMKDLKPEPTVEMHSKKAKELGLQEGEMVYIETKQGRIEQKLVFADDLDPRIISPSFGWWFPEEPENLFEWDKANVNILMSNEPAELASGTVETRGIPCKVYHVKK